jgi:hypothetical protein
MKGRLLLPSLAALIVNSACRQKESYPPEAATIRKTTLQVQVASEQIRARAETSFERAIFYKPREDSMAGLEMTFAPLLVQEIEDAGEAALGAFGALSGPNASPRVDPDRPTIYTGTFTARIKGVEHEQVVYLWRYQSPSEESGILSLEGRGVRITLGSDGFPLVWEALATNTDTRILFVSESLERAALREFGAPLPDRKFSIERPASESVNVIVARVLDDGPVPMGPYVYLNAPPERAITVVLCRCMPSQVNDLVATRYFDLMPLEAIREWSDTRSCVDPPLPRVHWGGTLSYWNLKVPWEEAPLEQVLRWPRMDGAP